MKRGVVLLGLFWAVFFIAFCGSVEKAFCQDDYTVRQGLKATFMLHVIPPLGDEMFGSGFFISDNQVLSAAHLMKFEGSRFFLDNDHQVELSVIKIDKEKDLMLLQSPEEHPHLNIHGGITTFQRVLLFGSPLASPVIVVEGRVAGFTDVITLIDATVHQGMSGGPVVDADSGKVVGVIVQMWGDRSWMAIAVAPELIKEFLR